MEIKVLGSGCSKCASVEKVIRQACEELNLNANIVGEHDMMKIMNYNVMSTPAVVINEKVVSSGKVLTLSQAKALLELYC